MNTDKTDRGLTQRLMPFDERDNEWQLSRREAIAAAVTYAIALAGATFLQGGAAFGDYVVIIGIATIAATAVVRMMRYTVDILWMSLVVILILYVTGALGIGI